MYLVSEDQKSESEINLERWQPDFSINIPSHEELMAIKRKKKVNNLFMFLFSVVNYSTLDKIGII